LSLFLLRKDDKYTYTRMAANQCLEDVPGIRPKQGAYMQQKAIRPENKKTNFKTGQIWSIPKRYALFPRVIIPEEQGFVLWRGNIAKAVPIRIQWFLTGRTTKLSR
jgi:hypothetical protein